MWQRRRAALVALACGAAAIALGAMLVLSHPVRDRCASRCWRGRWPRAGRARGARRYPWLAGAALLLAGNVVLLVGGRPMLLLGLVAALVLGIVAGGRAFAGHVALAPGARPRRPVLFFNPRSGAASTARHGCSPHRCGSEVGRRPSAAGSPAITPAPRRRLSYPSAPGTCFVRWSRLLPGALAATTDDGAPRRDQCLGATDTTSIWKNCPSNGAGAGGISGMTMFWWLAIEMSLSS